MFEDLKRDALAAGILIDANSPPKRCFALDFNIGALYVKRNLPALARLVEIARQYQLENLILEQLVLKSDVYQLFWPARLNFYRRTDFPHRYITLGDLLRLNGYLG
jgi:hypothetical protein